MHFLVRTELERWVVFYRQKILLNLVSKWAKRRQRSWFSSVLSLCNLSGAFNTQSLISERFIYIFILLSKESGKCSLNLFSSSLDLWRESFHSSVLNWRIRNSTSSSSAVSMWFILLIRDEWREINCNGFSGLKWRLNHDAVQSCTVYSLGIGRTSERLKMKQIRVNVDLWNVELIKR